MIDAQDRPHHLSRPLTTIIRATGKPVKQANLPCNDKELQIRDYPIVSPIAKSSGHL